MQTRNWETIKEYKEILFDFYNGIARITINRPRYRNAFTPTTTAEMSDALLRCRRTSAFRWWSSRVRATWPAAAVVTCT